MTINQLLAAAKTCEEVAQSLSEDDETLLPDAGFYNQERGQGNNDESDICQLLR